MCTGTIGGLGAWGVDMDTVVMINVVMAIGLAVDYAAHISYHYFKEGNSVNGIERMAASVEAIAYAAAQVYDYSIVPIFLHKKRSWLWYVYMPSRCDGQYNA